MIPKRSWRPGGWPFSPENGKSPRLQVKKLGAQARGNQVSVLLHFMLSTRSIRLPSSALRTKKVVAVCQVRARFHLIRVRTASDEEQSFILYYATGQRMGMRIRRTRPVLPTFLRGSTSKHWILPTYLDTYLK